MTLDHHLELEPLVDADLRLDFPNERNAESFARNSRHERVRTEFPAYYNMTVPELTKWISVVNGGRSLNKDPRAPIYWFWVYVEVDSRREVVGDMQVRITQAESAIEAMGHLGFHMLPQFRGRGYMTR